MGGIINYYHGEQGIVTNVSNFSSGTRTYRYIELEGNSHRTVAYDYGADVLIDPRIQRGDRVMFARLTAYDGIWVRSQDYVMPNVLEAVDLVVEMRLSHLGSNIVRMRLEDIWAEEAPEIESNQQGGHFISERPETAVSFFVSYSNKNVMLARSIDRDLRYDSKIDIWIDLEQGNNTGDWSRRKAEQWLKEGLFSSKGFLLLHTAAAAKSSWVTQEIEWAREKSHVDSEFRLIILKLSSDPVPENLPVNTKVIDGNGLWVINGLNEALFSAVFDRESRVKWKQRNSTFDEALNSHEHLHSYRDFESTSGIAIKLDMLDDGWTLEYEEDNRIIKIKQIEQNAIVDPEIRCGDLIASFVCNRNKLVRFWPGYKYWMRSADLMITPEDVAAKYFQMIGNNSMPARYESGEL